MRQESDNVQILMTSSRIGTSMQGSARTISVDVYVLESNSSRSSFNVTDHRIVWTGDTVHADRFSIADVAMTEGARMSDALHN